MSMSLYHVRQLKTKVDARVVRGKTEEFSANAFSDLTDNCVLSLDRITVHYQHVTVTSDRHYHLLLSTLTVVITYRCPQ